MWAFCLQSDVSRGKLFPSEVTSKSGVSFTNFMYKKGKQSQIFVTLILKETPPYSRYFEKYRKRRNMDFFLKKEPWFISQGLDDPDFTQ